MEVYETYGDHNTMRVLTQEIIQEAATVATAPRWPAGPARTARSSSTTSRTNGR